MLAHRTTRRDLFLLASATAAHSWSRLYAGDAEFWNKKDPSQWTVAEIDKLMTKSPWARQLTVSPQSRADDRGDMGGNRRDMGGGMGRGHRRGGMPVQYQVVVRWLSAKPLQLALKTPLPESMANHFIISVTGVPLSKAGHAPPSQDESQPTSHAAILDRIKAMTYLDPKGKSPAQPGVVKQATEPDTILFAFSRDLLSLSPDDKDVTFTTQMGRIEIKTKFNPKDMRYRNELAL